MNTPKSASILMIMFAASGCVSTDAVMMNSSRTYPPTDNVAILLEEPDRNYEIIAIGEGYSGPTCSSRCITPQANMHTTSRSYLYRMAMAFIVILLPPGMARRLPSIFEIYVVGTY